MSRKHGKKAISQLPVLEGTYVHSGLVSTFSEKVGVPMKNVDDLMSWIVFGKPGERVRQFSNEGF